MVTLNKTVISGGPNVKTETISSVEYPVSKLYTGADGVNGGPVTSINPLFVSAVNPGTPIAKLGAFTTNDPVDVSGATVPVRLHGITGINTHTAGAAILIYDALAEDVTVGVTDPAWVFILAPDLTAQNLPLPNGIRLANGFSWAATNLSYDNPGSLVTAFIMFEDDI
jgi:hypothetical protein